MQNYLFDLYIIYSNKYDPKNPNSLLVIKELKGLSDGARIAYTVAISALPIAALVLGIVVHIKRRNL